MNRSLIIAPMLLAGALVGTAHAQGGPRPDQFGDATVSRADAQARAVHEFSRLDIDHDGSLSGDELSAMFPAGSHGGQMGGMGGMMARMADTNGDGKLTQNEFVAAAMNRFDRADANHDGQLTKAERDAEREAHRARMSNDRPRADPHPDEQSDRPMGRGDGTPMPPPPDDDGQ